MANTRAPIQNIPLNGTLNLDILHSDIKPYQGFNKRNSPIVGGALSPVYHKSTATAGAVAVTTDSSIYEIKAVAGGFDFTRDHVLIHKYDPSTKFIHSKDFNLGAKTIATKATSNGCFIYSADGYIRHYELSEGSPVLKGRCEVPDVEGSILGATFLDNSVYSTGLLFIWHNYTELTCYKFSYSTYTGSVTSHSTVGINIGDGALVYPFLSVTPQSYDGDGGVTRAILNLVLKTGAHVDSPASYHFYYDTINGTLTSTTPMSFSYDQTPEAGVYTVFPTYLTEDGRVFIEESDLGKTSAETSTSVTEALRIGGCEFRAHVETGLFNLPSSYTYKYKIDFMLASGIKSYNVQIQYKQRDSQSAAVTTKTVNLTISSSTQTSWSATWTSNYSGIDPSADQSIVITVTSMTPRENSSITGLSFSDPKILDWNPGTDTDNSQTCTITYTMAGVASQKLYFRGSLANSSVINNNTIPVSLEDGYSVVACPPSYSVYNTGKTISQPLNCFYEISKNSYRVMVPISLNMYWINFTPQTKGKIPYCLLVDCYGTGVYSGAPYSRSEGADLIPFGDRYEGLGFTTLYNYGKPSGVSYIDQVNALGVLVSDWFSFTDDPNLEPSCEGNICTCVFSSNSSGFTFYWADSVPELYEFNGTIIIPCARRNVYTPRSGLQTSFLDYNNRVIPASTEYPVHSSPVLPTDFYDAGDGYYFLYGSAFNPHYEVSGSPFIGIVLPETVLFRYRVLGARFELPATVTLQITSTTDESIDFYYSGTSNESPTDSSLELAAPYRVSLLSGKLTTLAVYVGLYYPSLSGTGLDNVLYSLPVTARYIKTYVGQDLVLVNGVAYPMLKNNLGKYVFGVYLLSGVPGVKECFVIQGQVYAITEDYIRQLEYSQGINTNMNIICSCQGLEFVGFDTKKALFYSPYERSIHVFTGDNVIERALQCTQITETGAWAYNPATNSILVATNIGLIVFSETMGTYVVAEETNIREIVTARDDVFLIKGGTIDRIRLLPSEGFSVYPIKAETEYYGLGNSQVSKVDTVYVKVYNPTPVAAKIIVYSKVLTDIGVQTEAKTFNIKETDWDKETNSVYLRYQPKFQTSVGFSVGIESDVPIYNLSLGTTPTGVTQVTKNSI